MGKVVKKDKNEEVEGEERGRRTKCKFWLKKKNRYCKLQRMSEEIPFCGEHIGGDAAIALPDGRLKERIPCPLDKSHTCFKHLLDKHVAKCNSRRPSVLPPYFEEDVNLHISSSSASSNKEGNVGRSVSSLSDKEYFEVMEKIIKTHYENDMTPTLFSNPPLPVKVKEIETKADRHVRQIEGIITTMESSSLLKDNTAFIELGAGRGGVTYHLARKVVEEKGLKNCKFYVIDMASPRHKQDNKIKIDNPSVSWSVVRIRVDIKDLKVGELPGIKEMEGIVGVAKHLCGSATDMALHSLLNSSSNSEASKVLGFCIATCCHHKCEYGSYAGYEPFQTWFKREEFDMLKVLTSWATCGDEAGRIDNDREVPTEIKMTLKNHQLLYKDKYPYPHMDIFLKKSVGYMIKDILDQGRLLYAKNRAGVSVSLFEYADRLTTLENRAILGYCNIVS